jgi:nuclear transcription factor Y, gamma
MEESQEPSGGVKRPATEAETTEANIETAQPPPAKKPAATASSVTPAQAALQRQIQQQLQEQLQQQLQAAAARGQQAHITPAQIQAQAAAMVQAAAQAQAVVAAAKARSPNNQLQPMSASQIAALSQIQAAAIVNSRRTSAASADSKKPDLTPAQIQTQIQIQAQALIHAHTQAQIQAGIYKGDDTVAATTTAKSSATTTTPVVPPPAATAVSKAAPLAAPAPNLSAEMPMVATAASTNMVAGMDPMDLASQDSNSPAFQQQLSSALQEFWATASAQIHNLSNQTEQDFKTHNDLPLARIKRIMKSDEDVRMISAEAPVLFAKACELFILDLSVRSWNYSQLHKRRTLQKEDVKEAIQKTDIFDFLVDVIQ